MAKGQTKNYSIKYRILDEPGIRELYGDVSALSVIQATDFAEKMLINDGLEFSSFEIVEVVEAGFNADKYHPNPPTFEIVPTEE